MADVPTGEGVAPDVSKTAAAEAPESPVSPVGPTADAERAKEEGNAFFKAKQYQEAIASYKRATELDPKCAAYFLNLSIAHLKVEENALALEAARTAIELEPANVKGLYRRASAYVAMGRHDEAKRDLEMVVRKRPNDPDAIKKLDACKKTLFLRAISGPDRPPPPSRTLRGQMVTMSAPASYKGPRWDEGDSPPPSFLTELAEWLRRQEQLHEKYAYKVLIKAMDVLKEESNCTTVEVPADSNIHVCGDTHGQFYDLLYIFERAGMPSPTNRFLFNGDFVDRGSYSVEVALMLLACKITFPQSVYLTRGNHEDRKLNQVYGFEGEVKHKYNLTMYDLFHEVFYTLPVCACINKKVFVVHGGLFSRDDVTIADINAQNRFQDIPESGLLGEMLWSDPMPRPGRCPSKRGVGMQFGPDVTRNFLDKNKLELVIRSHEVKPDGYAVEHYGLLITVFSAPNYCDQLGNKGAYVELKPGPIGTPGISYTFETYGSNKHPGVKAMYYSPLSALMGLM